MTSTEIDVEKNEISLHECRFYKTLKSHPERWMTHKELAELSKISPRTARAYTLKLTKLGLLDVAEVFPSHRYKLAEKGARRNLSYVNRLEAACEVFGEEVTNG